MANTFGGWAFLVGIVLAVIFGILNMGGTIIPAILVIIGLLIGILNIADRETQPFLLAGTVLVIVSALGAKPLEVLGIVSNILNALLMIFVPATVIVALKSVFALAKEY